jgi:tRNA (guanine37-N1)-methyltransferase
MQTDQFQQAIAFCSRKPVTRVLALDGLERGTARVLGLEPGALLLYDARLDGHLLCWEEEETARRLLQRLPACEMLLLEHVALEEEARARFGFKGGIHCHSCARLSRERVPVGYPLELRPLTTADFDMVWAHYQQLDEAGVRSALAEGRMFGGWLTEGLHSGQMVGFVGIHAEGALGMLYVFERFRRQGFAYAMEGLMINRQLDHHLRVYGQVVVGNETSTRLHRRLGYVFADAPSAWLW